jgi:hypothetical protein
MSKEDQELLRSARASAARAAQAVGPYVGEASGPSSRTPACSSSKPTRRRFYAATQSDPADKYGAKYADLIKRIEATT